MKRSRCRHIWRCYEDLYLASLLLSRERRRNNREVVVPEPLPERRREWVRVSETIVRVRGGERDELGEAC